MKKKIIFIFIIFLFAFNLKIFSKIDLKNVNFEIETGIGYMYPDDIYFSKEGYEKKNLLNYYDYYQVSYVFNDNYMKSVTFVPLDINVYYKINSKIYLGLGFHYSYMGRDSGFSISSDWLTTKQDVNFVYKNKFKYCIPKFVFKYLITKSINLSLDLGFSFLTLNFEEKENYNENNYSFQNRTNINASGMGVYSSISIQYKILKLFKKINSSIKLRIFWGSAGNLKGTKNVEIKDSNNNYFCKNLDGYLYEHKESLINGLEYTIWDLFETGNGLNRLSFNYKGFVLSVCFDF